MILAKGKIQSEAARKIDKDRKQKIWDQLVHAVSKAIQRKKENVNLTRMNIESIPEIMNTGNGIFLTINLADNIMKDLNNSVLLSLTRLTQLFLMDNNLLSLPDMTTMLSLTLLDVDGNELEILKGATKTLNKHQPLIVVELCPYQHDQHTGSFTDLIQLVIEAGYGLFDISSDKLISTEPVQVEKSIPWGTGKNVLLRKRT